MRTLALDGRTGASGDMVLGALVAAGADPDVLAPVSDALAVSYEVSEVTRTGVTATRVAVVHDDADADGDTDGSDRDHDDRDDHAHDHDHSHDHAEGHGPSRTYDEVVEIVESMSVPERVADRAVAVFERLGRAEAAVHGTDLSATAFHEVGADDAVADVVGATLLFDDLGPERVVATPVSAGGGEVEFSHGRYPVPTPAVVEIAADADWELVGGPVDAELLTPTGAAILAEYADGVDSLPPLRVERSGYGAGGMALADRPNVLRATVGDARGSLAREDVAVLETNLDDATPEVLGGLRESLAEVGALDVSVTPLGMKKSRPGHLVRVVARPGDAERVAHRLATETGTLGVRESGAAHRWVARRHFRTAVLALGGDRHEVTVKVAADESGAVYDLSAEYEDAAAVADAADVPVRDVVARAEAAVRGDRSDVILHVVETDRWAALGEDEDYAPPSLDAEGFVHCSKPEQVVGVADANYADADVSLLVVDPARLDADVKYEPQATGHFPHVYGPIDRDAVVAVREFPREDGHFVLPDF